ncbi:ATP-dependent RNA helicase DbpA, partial [Pseudoalteromonas piscicida]
EEALDCIVSHCPTQRQNLLFSATYPAKIEQLVGHIMRDPVKVEVVAQHDHSTIEQHFYEVADNEARDAALHKLLCQFQPEAAVVFCNTKAQCQDVSDMLQSSGFDSAALHGDLD